MDRLGAGMTAAIVVPEPSRATTVTATAVTATATEQWRRRVLRISSLCEIGFGTLWFAKGIHAQVPLAAPVVVLIGAVTLATSIIRTRGTAPRPTAPGASRLERKVTVASGAQIALSVVGPVALVATGRGTLAVPFVIVTVGALFVYLHRLLQVPRLGALGAALVAFPVVAVAALSGSAQFAVALLGPAALMIANGASTAWTLSRHREWV